MIDLKKTKSDKARFAANVVPPEDSSGFSAIIQESDWPALKKALTEYEAKYIPASEEPGRVLRCCKPIDYEMDGNRAYPKLGEPCYSLGLLGASGEVVPVGFIDDDRYTVFSVAIEPISPGIARDDRVGILCPPRTLVAKTPFTQKIVEEIFWYSEEILDIPAGIKFGRPLRFIQQLDEGIYWMCRRALLVSQEIWFPDYNDAWDTVFMKTYDESITDEQFEEAFNKLLEITSENMIDIFRTLPRIARDFESEGRPMIGQIEGAPRMPFLVASFMYLYTQPNLSFPEYSVNGITYDFTQEQRKNRENIAFLSKQEAAEIYVEAAKDTVKFLEDNGKAVPPMLKEHANWTF